jgi:predicted RND superfamily exporter protein
VRGDFSNLAVLAALQASIDSMEANEFLSRTTDGRLNIVQPHVLEIGRLITSSEYARGQVAEVTGVEISDTSAYGLPVTQEEMRAVLDYAVELGVPTGPDTLIYSAERVRTALRHDPAGVQTDEVVLTVFLPGTREQETVKEAKAAIERDLAPLGSAAGVEDYGVTGSPFVRQTQLDATTRSLQTSIPIAAVASLVVLGVLMRSIRYAVVTTVPIGLVVAWLYAIMHVTGFALNFVTATIGAVSIGVGIDYSIHMTQRFREELARSPDRITALRRAAGGTGVALGASAASSVVGFAIMGLAPMPLFSSYGLLTAAMIVLALVAALFVLPALLLLVTPENAGEPVVQPAVEVKC